MNDMDSLLKYLIEQGGSDLHLKAGLKPAIRVHGQLTPIESVPAYTPESIMELIYSILSEEQVNLFENDERTRNELDFAYGLPGIGRFRFNIHRQRGTLGAVARSISTEIPDIESLGLPPAVLEFAKVSKGLALVTGPTGSGKSTSLAAIIDWINRNRREHIITIEDPIEYIHNSKKSYVMQREVGETADTLSFRNALKYALRQDPDVILIGEMRDYDTIGVAITSAETGHLVFGTLHTPSCAQTIGRIIDVFPADQQPQVVTQLASNLIGVVSQILLPTADEKGRAVAAEVMKCNSAIRNQIRTGSIDGLYQSIQTGSKEGMITMDQSILKLVKDGRVSFETAQPHIRDEVTKRQLEQYRGKSNAPVMEPMPSAPPAASDPSRDSNGGGSSKRASMADLPPWEQK